MVFLFILVIILAVIIVVLLAALAFVPSKPGQQKQLEDIQIISPAANAEVSLPFKVTGVINDNGWAGFEGQVGIVDIISES